jgi:hypothetical protein
MERSPDQEQKPEIKLRSAIIPKYLGFLTGRTGRLALPWPLFARQNIL